MRCQSIIKVQIASSRGKLCRRRRKDFYDPKREHDACGVGFVADLKARPSHKIVEQGLQILENLTHRGAVGADPLAGDGAGILVQNSA